MADRDLPAFFDVSGEELVPAPHARSAWSPDMLHGRLLGGLLARALERDQAAPGFHFSRLTVDLFKNSKLVPLRVETTRVRDGRRIRVADAVVLGPDGPIARASSVQLKRTEHPSGDIPTTPAWDIPEPAVLGPPPTVPLRPGYWGVPWDLWMFDDAGNVTVNWRGANCRRAWLRDTHELVSSESLSPFVRIALAADFASPLAVGGSKGLEFINADYTLYLRRLPCSEEVGLAANGYVGEEGIAAGTCVMHDTAGPIGFCNVTAVANPTSSLGKA